jgi:hypothetical protein
MDRFVLKKFNIFNKKVFNLWIARIGSLKGGLFLSKNTYFPHSSIAFPGTIDDLQGQIPQKTSASIGSPSRQSLCPGGL